MTTSDSADFRDAAHGPRPFSSLGRREMVLGAAALVALLGVFVGLAILLHDNRSAEPEFFGGGAFVAWSQDGQDGQEVRPPPSFNVVDGRPEVAIRALGADYFAPPVDPSNLVPVNTPAGTYFVDQPSGHARSFDRGYRARGLASTTSEGGQSLQMTPGVAVRATGAAGDVLYVLSESDNQVTLRTVSPDLADFDQVDGQVALSGSLPDAPVVAATADAVWIAVEEAQASADTGSGDPNPALVLYRVGVGPESAADLASTDASDSGESGDEEVNSTDTRLLESELLLRDLPGDAALTPIEGRDWVATASISRASVVFHLPDGTTRNVPVPELDAALDVIPLGGDDGATFLIQTPSDGWSVVTVDPDDLGRRVARVKDSAGWLLTAGVVLGSRAVSVDQATGRVAVIDLDGLGDARELVATLYDYRTALASSAPAGPLTSVSVDVFANRVFVNSAPESMAVMVRPTSQDEVEVLLLNKDSVREIELPGEDAMVPLPPPPEPIPGDDPPPGSVTEFCDETSDEDRTPVILPQLEPSAPRAIDVAWLYPEATTDFCAPVAEVVVRQGGREVRRVLLPGTAANNTRIDGLEVNSEYEVTVEALYNRGNADEEFRRTSAPEVFRTSELGPCPVNDPRAQSNSEGWSVSWSAPAVRGPDCGGRVVAYEVQVDGLEQVGLLFEQTSSLSYSLLFDGSNIGLSPRFRVFALGSESQRSNPWESAPLLGERPPDCVALEARFNPRNGSGSKPSFGVNFGGFPSRSDYAAELGTRAVVEVKAEVDVTQQRTLSLEAAGPFDLLATDVQAKAGLPWETLVSVSTPQGSCNNLKFSGSNEKLTCSVKAENFSAAVTPFGETTSDRWVVKFSANAAMVFPDCVTAWAVNPTGPSQCGRRRTVNNEFLVSSGCASTPKFSVVSFKVKQAYSLDLEGGVGGALQIELDLALFVEPSPPKIDYSVSCSWFEGDKDNDAVAGWACSLGDSYLGVTPVSGLLDIRRSLSDGPYWNQKVPLDEADRDNLIGSCLLTVTYPDETEVSERFDPHLFDDERNVGCRFRMPLAPS